ncbi:MAG: hypothetical protein KDC87_17490, partial [Planctomycetes bacterium]|nr:hypothetical protein [Planctomycetota bacterium]
MPTHRPAAFFPCALFALSITLLAAGSAAQTTHVVDAKGGPGSNYLDIQAAVDAASPGDRIVVRAGAYLVFQVTKPLSISAEAGVQVGSGIDPNRAEVIVRGIGAGQTFSMHGVDLVVSWKTFPVVVDQCLGTVILEGANVLFPGGTAGVLATDCRDLRVVRLRI